VDQVLAAIVDACPIEQAALMAPDDGTTAAAEPGLRELVGAHVPVSRLSRADFYTACRQPDLAVAATGAQPRSGLRPGPQPSPHPP
jgi:L-fucose mutarotase